VLTRLNGLDFSIELEGHGPPLLLLHGFTGSSRVWDDIRRELAASTTVIALDLIGHGRSAVPLDPARYSLEHAAGDLAALLDALGFESVDLLGYSMGGRLALHFAVAHRARVRRLILESASPGIQDPAERQQRIRADTALAQRILEFGVEAFVAEWERNPLLGLAPHVPRQVRERQQRQRLTNDPLGLANSLRGMGAGQQQPLWSSLPELTTGITLIAGETDARYRDIAQRMSALLPQSHAEVVPHAGHTVHIDQPEEFARLLRHALAPAKCTKSTN
jgi:2-succinyl-6-hydroxy-2,4-cyclohexadiene-1-carboxylate synthase